MEPLLCPHVTLFARIVIEEQEKAELGRFSKNFLPIFFNVYSQEPPAGESNTYRMAVLDTIKVYLTVTQTEVILLVLSSV